ncbi:hypothetical protein [Frankia sp. Cr2]|uniref:hypothetical protein n=1 Tax=Frankia sp. Cr2 TaxID=3073932 RepID=UPI002AD4D55A|nr:hypothetical protein [Frankia sp. Cr2]
MTTPLAKFDDAWFSEKVAGPIATSLEKGEQIVVTVGPRRRDAETQAFGCGVKVDRSTTSASQRPRPQGVESDDKEASRQSRRR